MNRAAESNITLTFAAGTDPDMAQVQVQNRLSQAQSSLPEVVQRLGVTVIKTTASFLKVIGLTSTDGSISSAELGDYLVSSIQEPLSRVDGVGEVEVFGSAFAMRIWLDPENFTNSLSLRQTLRPRSPRRTCRYPPDRWAACPAAKGTALNAVITSSSLLETPEQFGAIFLKTQENGSQVFLRDVARIEKGPKMYEATAFFNGKPTAGLAIKLASGANALLTSDLVDKKWKSCLISSLRSMSM